MSNQFRPATIGELFYNTPIPLANTCGANVKATSGNKPLPPPPLFGNSVSDEKDPNWIIFACVVVVASLVIYLIYDKNKQPENRSLRNEEKKSEENNGTKPIPIQNNASDIDQNLNSNTPQPF